MLLVLTSNTCFHTIDVSNQSTEKVAYAFKKTKTKEQKKKKNKSDDFAEYCILETARKQEMVPELILGPGLSCF